MPKPRILLVDDEERFRTNLQKMLGAQGLTVRAAGSGAEALEELKLQPLRRHCPGYPHAGYGWAGHPEGDQAGSTRRWR